MPHSGYVVQRSDEGIAVSVHLPALEQGASDERGRAPSPVDGLSRNHSMSGSVAELHVAQRRSIPTQPIGQPTRLEQLSRYCRISTETKKMFWDFFDDPSTSRLAMGWSVLILALIITSCAAFVLETEPSLCCGRYEDFWFTIEVVCVSFFTLEYIGRVLCCPDDYGRRAATEEDQQVKPKKRRRRQNTRGWPRIRFILSIMNVIDLVAIVPFYVELFAQGNGGNFGFVRVVRLARVFRLLKLGKYTEGLNLLSTTMRESMQGLGMLSFFLIIAVTLLSSAMFFAERGQFCYEGNDWCDGLAAQPHGYGWYHVDGLLTEAGPWCDEEADAWCALKSDFDSIFSAGYFVIASVTTLGYGDISPVTTPGQIIGCLVMFCGLVILALPITVISTNFAQAYEDGEYRRLAAQHRQNKSMSVAAKAVQSLLARGKSVTSLMKRTMSNQDAAVLTDAAKEAVRRDSTVSTSSKQGMARFRFNASKLSNGSSKKLLHPADVERGEQGGPEHAGDGHVASPQGSKAGRRSSQVEGGRRASTASVQRESKREGSPAGRGHVNGSGGERARGGEGVGGGGGGGGGGGDRNGGGITIYRAGAPLARQNTLSRKGSTSSLSGGDGAQMTRQGSLRTSHFRRRRSSLTGRRPSASHGEEEGGGGAPPQESPLDMFKDMEEEEARAIQELLDKHCLDVSNAIQELLLKSTKDIVRIVLEELARAEHDEIQERDHPDTPR